MQSDHVPKVEDYSDESDFLTAFTMSGDFLASVHGPSMSTPSHRRNLSNESTSSLVERSTPSGRNHPSLPYPRRSPYAGMTPLPGQGIRHLSTVPPAYTSSSPHSRASRSTPSDEEDDDYVEELPPNPTPEQRAAYKRRLNTIAARRSRKRRTDELKELKATVISLNRECDIWKERAMMMARMLSANGLQYPPLPGLSIV